MTTKLYVSEAQAARQLGISRERLRQLRNQGRAPNHRFCGEGRKRKSVLYEAAAVERWAAQRRERG